MKKEAIFSIVVFMMMSIIVTLMVYQAYGPLEVPWWAKVETLYEKWVEMLDYTDAVIERWWR